MTIQLELERALEASLERQAKERGLSVSEYVQDLVRHDAASRMNSEEKAAAFIEWVNNFPKVPVLPDEAMTRESLNRKHP